MARGDRESLQYLFSEIIPANEGPFLMTIYGLGAASIFLTMALMYAYALRKRTFLELDEVEQFETRSSLGINLALASVPLLSALIATLGIGGDSTFIISGFTYFLYPIIMPVYGFKIDKIRTRKFKSAAKD